jgi:hypothetical protein
MGVSVEEPEEAVLEFRELLLAGKSIVVLEVIVQQMNGLGLE